MDLARSLVSDESNPSEPFVNIHQESSEHLTGMFCSEHKLDTGMLKNVTSNHCKSLAF
jgi:hypothetical protein